MNVTKILHLAKIYSGMNWQDWESSDLFDVHQLLTALAQKHTVKYEIKMIQDEPALFEEAIRKGSIEMLHDLIEEAINEGNFYAVRETLEQMLVTCNELVEDEKKQAELQS